MKMWSTSTECCSEPSMWLPICPTFKIFVEKLNGAERETQGERSESFSQSNSMNFFVLDTNINYLDFDV